MNKRKLLIVGFLAFSAPLILSQTLPSTLPSKGTRYAVGKADPLAHAYIFHLGGKHYRAKITGQEIDAGPGWMPNMPLPLSMANAEELARAELRKLGVDDSGWEVSQLQLSRRGKLPRAWHVQDLPDADDLPKWYYVVGLTPATRNTKAASDSFFAVMNLSGKGGTIELTTPR